MKKQGVCVALCLCLLFASSCEKEAETAVFSEIISGTSPATTTTAVTTTPPEVTVTVTITTAAVTTTTPAVTTTAETTTTTPAVTTTAETTTTTPAVTTTAETTTTPPAVTTTTETTTTPPAVTTTAETTTATPAVTTTAATTTAPAVVMEVTHAENGVFQDALAYEVLSLINAERAKEGLAALSWDNEYTVSAKIRVAELPHLWSHTRPDGREWMTVIEEMGIDYNHIAENCAFGGSSQNSVSWFTPQEAVEMWMNSEGHRVNILSDKYELLGVACYDENGFRYYVKHFGKNF